jgi:hypothetical protein
MQPPDAVRWTPPSWRVLTLVCLLVILLNVFDAVSTLEVIRRGGEEGNPLARIMLRFGDAAFFFWKTGLASACAIAIACLARVRRAAWWGFWAVVAIYGAIAALHVYLLWIIAPSAAG